MIKNVILKSYIIGVLLFIISSFISYSEICCAFGATRYYGWPKSFLIINKTTDILAEAEKIENKSAIYLLKNGWDIRLGTDMFSLGSSQTHMIINFLFYFSIIYIILFLYNKITIFNTTTKILKK